MQGALFAGALDARFAARPGSGGGVPGGAARAAGRVRPHERDDAVSAAGRHVRAVRPRLTAAQRLWKHTFSSQDARTKVVVCNVHFVLSTQHLSVQRKQVLKTNHAPSDPHLEPKTQSRQTDLQACLKGGIHFTLPVDLHVHK